MLCFRCVSSNLNIFSVLSAISEGVLHASNHVVAANVTTANANQDP